VRVLLDTHAFLWILGDWKRVRPAARRTLEHADTTLHLSAASIWEISIKAALGRLTLPASPPVYLPRRIADFHLTVVNVAGDHAMAVFSLPPHHADPFDRILVAQAQLEELTIATRDRIFRSYSVAVLPI
jgi:PIN domain nuclease of toxin-antitoxin system